MAELESAISFLLNQLTLWLQHEQELLGGLDEDVKWILNEMGQIRAFLEVADSKEESNPQFKERVRQVRELAYDIEDVHDEYMFKISIPGANGFRGHVRKMFAPMKILMARREFVSQMQTIKSRVNNVSESWKRYNDETDKGSSSINKCHDRRGDALLLEAADVVGIEKRKKMPLKWLLSADFGLKVISVVGMGGLGKTTLVKKVYGDADVKANFNHHVWITVSQSFRIANLLRNMIRQLCEEIKQPPPQEMEDMAVDQMKELIRNFLLHKTYIIVLDDVWKLNAWETFRHIFPSKDTNGCGRVIITTRVKDIADSASKDTNGHVYQLEPLSAEESRKLFHSKAFPRYSCPSYLENHCENILRRCGGLPLAIVVIGGLLANKNNNIEEWDLFNRSLGHELEGENLKDITKILSLSYLDLPSHQKSCFLYLSIFPEDALLEKWRLIRVWISEGFVLENQWMTPEEVAEGYLKELLNRNLLQVATLSYDGRPKEFRIHDVVREYIVSKSREQNIVATNGGQEIGWPKKSRRLAVHNPITSPPQDHDFRGLRSLLLSTMSDSEFGKNPYESLLGRCRLLKVLEMRGASFHTIPKEVFKLYSLKYLSLRNTKIKSIPKSIQNLKHLETLDLKESDVTKLPREILKLKKLRHLLVYSYKEVYDYLPFHSKQGFQAPFELGKLTSLQKLMYTDAEEKDGVKVVLEIGKLTNLRRLGIMKLKREDGKDLCSSIAKLLQLRSLNLFAIEEDEKMDLDYSLSLPFLRTLVLHGSLDMVPRWVPSLDRLTVLHLRWSKLEEDPLRRLQGLPNLVVLNMDWAYEGEELIFRDGGFPKLKELLLQRLRGLRHVKVEKGSMPLLEKLYLTDCKSMAELPVGIEHLTNLQYVDFCDMAEEFLAMLVDQRRKDKLSLPPLKLGLTTHTTPLVWKIPETSHIIRLLSKH